jgi:DNA topoisomerase-2
MYQRLTHREHVLKRPDTYIGTLEFDDELGMSQGLYKIIDEIIVNGYDEYVRNPRKGYQIRLDTDGTTITVSNMTCIPDPNDLELIFGTLLTSSNYDDAKDRYTGGRNGYGAKLANIYSKYFKVTSCDSRNAVQTSIIWRDNMATMDPPVTTSYRNKTDWLHIEFIPSLGTFSPETLRSRMIEIGIWGPTVFFNGDNVTYTFKDFVGPGLIWHRQGNWEIYVGKSGDGEGFIQKSFVNGIATRKGGTHVDHVVGILAKALDMKPYQLKNHLTLFVKVSINKPEFSTQTKNECTSKITEHVEFKPKFIRDFKSLGIQSVVDTKKLKKTDGAKKATITGIPKLDDANWAGTTRSDVCTLIVTEGDSAKSLAVAGLSIVGRDAWGVFPLKGKPKNVRGASVKQLETNKEFSEIKKILGLKQGETYSDTRSLRYGRLMIMTDADLDGSHIKGLVLNMFEYFWPSLLNLGFVVAMVTPVIKADGAWFFTEEEFRTTGLRPKTIKYYKGLGTSTSAEAKEYFKNIKTLTVQFDVDKDAKDSMCLAFAKDRISDRKVWLRDYMALTQKPHVAYGKLTHLSVSDFIHKDQIKFSEEDIRRSIPHILDGFKPCQRKVIFAAFKKRLVRDMTVAQFSGYVGDVSAYHHGEASLHGTIIGLAQNFTGSNNINLLVPSGQFGSRLDGGKDHASARYISTRLEPVATRIFDSRDDPLLDWRTEDSKSIEPDHFIPIIPMILVNGADGIGTGYSTHVPPCNPADIIANMHRLLEKKPIVAMSPWFKGFTGRVTRKGNHTWVFHGVCTPDGWVTELPPGKWIQDYKEFLDGLVEAGTIRGYENHSTETTPRFKILATPIPSEDQLSLSKNVHTSNMFLITKNGLRKYDTYEEILIDYMKVRLDYYRKRKTHILSELSSRISKLETRMRFITLVIDGHIEVFRKTRTHVEKILGEYMFAPDSWSDLLGIKTYEYTSDELEKLQGLIDQANLEMRTLKQSTIVSLFKNDLLGM